MKASQKSIEVTLRIPGNWSGPEELFSRIPKGYRLAGKFLILPGGEKVEIHPLPPDGQLPGIFRMFCRRPATAAELAIVNQYSVNVCLTGPGGSLDAARTMMDAGAAIIRAGAGGVFIDNSGLAHGASQWLEMTGDGSPDAISFAFVAIVRGKEEVWTVGMNVLGFSDLVMKRSDADTDEQTIVETIQYICGSGKAVGDGHMLADENGPRYQVRSAGRDTFSAKSPMHNPLGRLKLVSVGDIAEQN